MLDGHVPYEDVPYGHVCRLRMCLSVGFLQKQSRGVAFYMHPGTQVAPSCFCYLLAPFLCTPKIGRRTVIVPKECSVLGPWSSVRGPWSSVLGPRSSVLGPWCLFFGPRSKVLVTWSSDLGPRSLALGPRSRHAVRSTSVHIFGMCAAMVGRAPGARQLSPAVKWLSANSKGLRCNQGEFGVSGENSSQTDQTAKYFS